MKTAGTLLVIIIIIAALAYAFGAGAPRDAATQNMDTNTSPVTVTPIMHATALLTWGGAHIYTDPTDPALLAGRPPADIILVTDIHGDHFSTSTLAAATGADTALIVPQAVADQLPTDLAAKAKILKNGETITEKGFAITGVPMYNIPESPDAFHTKGRGNGYVIERDGYRVYVAGDTSATPEMKALADIDIALIPMNLPYTMGVEEAADAVLAFKPKIVYPYHYRGPEGLSDVGRFKELVNADDSAIDVELADWYPQQ